MKKALSIFILVVLLVLSTLNYYEKKESAWMFGYKAFIHNTNQMDPTIKQGSLIFYTTDLGKTIGGILVFDYPLDVSKKYVGSIIEEKFDEDGSYFISKGESSNLPDPWRITEDMLIGEVEISIPYLGAILTFMRTHFGLFVVVVIPAVLIAYKESYSLFYGFKNALSSIYIWNRYRKVRKNLNIRSIK